MYRSTISKKQAVNLWKTPTAATLIDLAGTIVIANECLTFASCSYVIEDRHTQPPMTSLISPTEASGANNARAKLAGILAIYELERLEHHMRRGEALKDLKAHLSTDALELLDNAGYDLKNDPITADHISDVAWDACRSECLGVDYSATWSAGSDFDGNPDKFKVWLTVGGPSCYITGDFGLHGHIDKDSIRFCYSWACPTDWLSLSDAEEEALAWFVDRVAV